MKQIVVFEDLGFRDLLPLVYFRPVWELRCGALTIADKIIAKTRLPIHFLGRNYLQDNYLNPEKLFTKLNGDQPVWFINGRWLPDNHMVEGLKSIAPGQVVIYEDTALAFCTSVSTAASLRTDDGAIDASRIADALHPISLTQITDSKPLLIRYPWDLIRQNGAAIVRDFAQVVTTPGIHGTLHEGVHILEKENVFIANGAKIQPGVVINAGEGPVWIDEGATVMANSVLVGPLYVGKKSTIKIAAKIYENTSIGPVCKVGGEVEGSIIQSFSNKQHEGFLGHAYLGEWVNLGADTNNSDLKNNYGSVTVSINGRPINTGERFVGLIMGDHSKTAINTMFNTGTVVGVSCNIFGTGMPAKFIPSFSWGGAEGLTQYDFQKAMSVAKIVMGRRNVPFTQQTETLFASARRMAKQVEAGTLL